MRREDDDFFCNALWLMNESKNWLMPGHYRDLSGAYWHSHSRKKRESSIILNMATVHIPESEAVRDLPNLLARARAGEEIVIEKKDSPDIVLRVAAEPRGRLLSESIALAEMHAKEMGFEPVMDPEFAADLEAIIRNRKARDTSAWD